MAMVSFLLEFYSNSFTPNSQILGNTISIQLEFNKIQIFNSVKITLSPSGSKTTYSVRSEISLKRKLGHCLSRMRRIYSNYTGWVIGCWISAKKRVPTVCCYDSLDDRVVWLFAAYLQYFVLRPIFVYLFSYQNTHVRMHILEPNWNSLEFFSFKSKNYEHVYYPPVMLYTTQLLTLDTTCSFAMIFFFL